MCAAVVAGLLVAPPATAAPLRAQAQQEHPVRGVRVPAPAARVTAARKTLVRDAVARPPVWPAATTAEVAPAPARLSAEDHRLGARPVDGVETQPVRAGTSPVWVRTGGRGQAGKLRVQVYDHATARRAGADAVLLKVSGVTAAATVAVDYSSFAGAFGADWAQRLRFTVLPDCALSTPDLPQCAGRPVPTQADPAARTVATLVAANPATGTLLGLSAGASGNAGSYAATPLSASATWGAGDNSGAFTWSYPMRTPPGLGGPSPALALSYSSSSVDGRMAAGNNQPGWVGEGFDLDAGYIERKYRGCAEDMTGGNNSTKTGDLCWATDNATLSLSGHAGELLVDGSGVWHLRSDDGTRVERRTGAANGARNGEYWVATTPDGTQYWFGDQTQSALAVPVAGNQAGEPCHATAFADSFCAQAWRWNLDHVVDTHGNTMRYAYTKETNKYARNLKETDLAGYDRAAYLNRIDYGTRTDRTETAPMQVLFDTSDRCLADCATHDGTHWPDVPWDQECTASPCRNGAPTFWTTRRLTKVTTRTGGADVEAWTLTQSFPNPGDGTRAGLWLDRISHVGLGGGVTTPMPDVVLTGTQLNNRVDTTTDGYAAMNWWRIKDIDSEYGGRIEVTYSDRDCVVGSRMPDPNNLAANHLRCYPVKWTPDGKTSPILDFFHKYVATTITESDLTGGGSPRKVTAYDYVGDPAWHYTDDDGLITPDDRTWSDWRGYATVRVTVGDPGAQTSAENRYFRGMGGQLPAAGAAAAVTDEDAYAGMIREKVTFDGPGGAEVSGESYSPWQSDATATRTIAGSTVSSRHVGVAATYTRTALDGGRGDRTTSQTTGFDGFGAPVRVEDHGDDAVTGDEKCSLTDYTRNLSAWIVATAARTRTFAVTCAAADAGGLTDADVISDDRVSYDGQVYGAAPVKGDVTTTETLKGYNAGHPDYLTARQTADAYGRVVSSTDVRGNVTTTSYTPAAGGPVTAVGTTLPLGWTTRATLQPAWGSTLTRTDENQRTTEWTYDGLGRTTAAWLPGRDRSASQTPNMTYAYLVRGNAPTVLTTSRLNAAGGYVVSRSIYDGLLRVRQTQTADAAGGPNAVLTDSWYDAAGRPTRVTEPYLSTQPPGPDLIRSTDVIPVAGESVYDGAARIITSIRKVNVPPGGSPGGAERWRTTTAYGGDRIDSTPPAGDTVTSKVMDVHGRTVELRQYHPGTAAGSTDRAGYDLTTYAYNSKDKLTRLTDPAGNHWDYTYDLHNDVVAVDDPDKGRSRSTFDAFGQQVTSTDARDVTLAYTYDQLGRRTTVRDGSATGPVRARWTYDSVALGKVTSSTRYDGTDAYVTETLGFTADYQPTSVRYTIPGSTVNGTYTYSYTYGQDGSPLTERLPAVGDLKQETLTYGYDALGQATTVRSGYGVAAETDLVKQTAYTSFGELGAYTLRNNNGNVVSVTRTYETDTRRLAQISTAKQTSPTGVADIRYSYDDAGNVVKVAAVSDVAAADTQCFRSDHLRRLTDAWTPSTGDCTAAPAANGLGGPAKYWQSYGYDLAGDRTTLVEHATATGDRTTTYSVAAGSHRLDATRTTDGAGTATAAWGHDAAGNTTTRPGGAGSQTLTWDAEGHLAKVSDPTGPTSYLYDVDGSRLVRTDPAGTTLYLPGQELRFAGGNRTATRYYDHAGTQIGVRSSAGLTWLSGDQHGTASIAVNAVTQAVATRRETPFGLVRQTGGSWPSTMDKGFVGGTNDNTGLTHLGAREYDPGTGRFISVDPELDTSDPQQLNAYTYSNNNPITLSDPAGTKWNWGKILKVTAVVVAVVAVVAVAAVMPAAIPAMVAAAGNAAGGAAMFGATAGMAATAGLAAAAGEAAAATAVLAGSGVVASTMYMAGKIVSGYEQGDYPSGPVTPKSPANRNASGGRTNPDGPLREANPGQPGRPDGQTVISGHGSPTGKQTVAPEGTIPTFYVEHGKMLPASLGNDIEAGRAPVLEKYQYQPGQTMPDYWVHPHDKLELEGNPWVIDETGDHRGAVPLSSIMRPHMGPIHLAFCRGNEPLTVADLLADHDPWARPSAAAPEPAPVQRVKPGWNQGHSRFLGMD
ncbi:putative adhesin [Hamadaea tsunoensis]|uniref:putative adhesin n=1 Tax=Hamadaea tsunoensis TaxID=53368 RepID=UPI0006869E64|nr:RHS repeat-associated core domain-containing protein [Hamadaea tsunoensis]